MREQTARSQSSLNPDDSNDGKPLLYGLSLVSFLFLLGFGIALPSLPRAVEELGGSELDVGLVISIWALSYVAMGVPAGALLDRHDLRVTIPAAMVGNCFVGALYALGTSLPFLLVGRLLQGVLESFVWAGIFGLVSFKFPHSRTGALAIVTVFSSLGFSIGPTFNGLLFASAPARFGLIPVIATSLFSAILTIVLFHSRSVYHVRGGRRAPGVMSVVHSVDSVVALALVMTGIMGGFEGIVQAHNSDLLTGIGLPVALSGLLLSSYLVSALASRSSLPYTYRFFQRRYYPALSFLTALLVLLLGTYVIQSSWTLILQWIVIGALLGVNWITFQALIANTLGEKAPSTAMGIYNLSWGLGYMSMPPMVGLVTTRTGGHLAYVSLEILVTIGLLCGLVFFFTLRGERSF